jgi:RNA polymerase sigma-70 factor, ECF subfamily
VTGTTLHATHRAIDAVWRIEAARLIAGLARIVRDVGLAEDLAQDALVAALEQWPESGVPRSPGAWLMAVAKRRAIDQMRRDERLERKVDELGHELETGETEPAPDFDDDIGDDLLRLVFTACHPVLATEARVALTLRLLGGLTTEEIARAFLVSESTVAQRIVRAKRTLTAARVPFEVPHGDERAARLSSVLEVIYLVFNEGYAATAGDDWMRPALCEEALRLGRVLAELAPKEPEVHGLVALMEIQASRSRARIGPSGEPILLLDQNRAHWDQLLIRRGLTALQRAEELQHAKKKGGGPGPYALQAAIAACHARARTPDETDWTRIAALYETLARLAPSPVVELNRAVALSMAFGPATGLALVDELTSEPSLRGYHLLPSVRGDLLAKLGRFDEAREEFERAAALTRNGRERTLLRTRAATMRKRRPDVSGKFELHKQVELDASPEQVWQAIATGPGISSWFMGPHEIEPRAGGKITLTIGDFSEQSTITVWDSPTRLAYRGAEGADGSFHAMEYLIEAREGGSTVLRFVHSGFLSDDWGAEFQDQTSHGWDMYLHTLAQYLKYFPGRPGTYVYAEGPATEKGQDTWTVLIEALGLAGPVNNGDRLRLTPEGLTPIEGIVDYVYDAPEYREFLGVRSDDGLYRFHGGCGQISVGHHLFAENMSGEEAAKAWQEWLNQVFTGPVSP